MRVMRAAAVLFAVAAAPAAHAAPDGGVPPVSPAAAAAGFLDVRTVVPDAVIDLHLAAICQHLGLPPLPLHDALSDATTAALIFLRLHQGGPLAYPKV